MIEHSEHLNELAGALSKAQAEIKNAIRDSDNPFFKSKYADLASTWDACRVALTSHGLSVTQWPFTEPPAVGVLTMLLHSSGQWLRGRVSAVPKDLSPQSVGSTVSYLKRYSLAAVAGVATEDDDAETAQARTVTVPAQKPIDGEAPVPFDYEPPSDMPDPRPGFAAGDKTCPYCHKSTVIKGKAEYGGGWLCFQKRGGCGQKWPALPLDVVEAALERAMDKSTGELLEEGHRMDNRAFLLAGIVKDASAYQLTAAERKALADQFLGGKHAHECRDEAALNRLYMFLGDVAAVTQWRRERAA